MFGVTSKDVIGKPLTAIMPEKYRNDHEIGMKRFVQTKEPKVIGKVVELEGMHTDGRVFPMEMSLSTWKGDNDEQCFTAVVRDITARKKVEDDLKDKMNQLQKMNTLMVNRELKMVELKNKLKEQDEKLETPG